MLPIRKVVHRQCCKLQQMRAATANWGQFSQKMRKSSDAVPNPDPNMVNWAQSGRQPTPMNDVLVFPNVVSQVEHDSLVDELLESGQDRTFVSLRRRPYQSGHWDSVITGYKEAEAPLHKWNSSNQHTLQRIQMLINQIVSQREATPKTLEWLPPHIIDLAEHGFIDPHVDSVKFSGGLVCGLSLMSTRMMKLSPQTEEYTTPPPGDSLETISSKCDLAHPSEIIEHRVAEMLLPPRSLYILSGVGRYSMEHSIPLDALWNGKPLRNERRISIIFRDDKSMQFP